MIWSLLFVLHLAFCVKRLRRHLRSLQQEDYSPSRFLSWVWTQRAFDRRGTVSVLLGLVHWALAAVVLAIAAWREPDPRRSGKLCLNMTPRATRLFRISLFLVAIATFCLLPLSTTGRFTGLVLIYQLLPLALVAAVQILNPNERKQQQYYRSDAKSRLEQVAPLVIGITGSFGKTSTKNLLGELLSVSLAPTFWPKAGVNTEMGIVREIRERLVGGTRYAVIEMGAYGRGSIKRLCSLTPPQAAIITAIGHCHLERFGSTEEITRAKGELAEALPDGAFLVVNGDDPNARKIAERNPHTTPLYFGANAEKLDCRLLQHNLTDKGTEFTLLWKDNEYHGTMPLSGRPALFNMMASFTMAAALGADPALLIGAIANLTPVKHRLHLEKSDGITTLNDAYNSNPVGFRDALQLLNELPAKRRILMTPGMIELGETQKSENRAIAAAAGEICDEFLVVGETNREAIVTGLREAGVPPAKILECPDRDHALQQLAAMKRPGDAILVENDLPDIYESRERY